MSASPVSPTLLAAPSAAPGQVGRSDQARVPAEAGQHDLGEGPMATTREPVMVGGEHRIQQQAAGFRDPAADDEGTRVEDRGEIGQALADPGPDLLRPLARPR
jgi:hypothetical protein